jgi:hypothetical protein
MTCTQEACFLGLRDLRSLQLVTVRVHHWVSRARNFTDKNFSGWMFMAVHELGRERGWCRRKYEQ